ncbi:MAG: 30S ribosomal protein S16 [Thermoanaerobaculia bacterium]|nr:30S ribosomal protein S16 [Thermoanaerobaculia bacterium]
MVKIRLRRMGSRNHPYYRVVVSDSRKTPLAEALEEIGHYDPRQEPSVFEIDMDRYEHWRQNGAGVSETVRKLVARG